MQNLLKHTSGHDAFVRYMTEANIDHLTKYILKLSGQKQLGEYVKLDSGTLAPLLKRLEKQGIVNRKRPEYNENTLMISLTEEGKALKDDALSVPEMMKDCTGLSVEECSVLRGLLDKALANMNQRKEKFNKA